MTVRPFNHSILVIGVLAGGQCMAPIGDDALSHISASHGDEHGAGRLTQVFDWSGSREVHYDERGRVVETIRRLSGGGTHSVEKRYDALDRVVEQTYPGGFVVGVEYDRGLRVRRVYREVSGTQEDYVTRMTYTVLGQRDDIEYGNGVLTDGRYGGGRQRLLSLTTSASDNRMDAPGSASAALRTTLQVVSYGYDSTGNVGSMQIEQIGRAVGMRNFGYDELDRLVTANQGSLQLGQGVAWQRYHYDAVGNLREQDKHDGQGTLIESHRYSYDHLSHVHAVSSDSVKRYDYDPNGNVVCIYDQGQSGCDTNRDKVIHWNESNYPTSIVMAGQLVAQYDYDGDHERVTKTDRNGAVTTYLGQTILEPDGTSTHFIEADGLRIAEVNSTRGVRYYHSDLLGSTAMVTDATGNAAELTSYEPYGPRQSNQPSTVRYSFTGQEEESDTGYHNYGARLYDAELGRFLSADSIVPDTANPQAFNRYSYVYNNPLRYSDPTGHGPRERMRGITVGADSQGLRITANLAVYSLDGAPIETDKVQRWSESISRTWNGAVDGVLVQFDVNVRIVSSRSEIRGDEIVVAVNTGNDGARGAPGFITICWADVGSTRVISHEFGHAMGLDDGYERRIVDGTERVVAKPGAEGSTMGVSQYVAEDGTLQWAPTSPVATDRERSAAVHNMLQSVSPVDTGPRSSSAGWTPPSRLEPIAVPDAPVRQGSGRRWWQFWKR